MVIAPSNRRGTSSTGCLLTLLAFAVALYYVINIGEVYWRFYQYQDEMRSQARLAPSISDGVIRRRLLLTVDRLGLPSEAQKIQIKRTARPRQITIESEYAEEVVLPLFHHTFQFRPHAIEGL
ncbi:MAG TPA: hypothetical protein VFV65_02245 [Gemmatimonadales bacterium]|nr:hypothetical protein [Gemmatimonadales bacterium]